MPSEPEIQVLKSSEDFLAIYKPPGVAFHSTENAGSGILPILRRMEEAGVIPAGERLYPVHRLDKVTSGILLFARGRKNANQLGNEFRHGRVEKVYLALSDRRPSKKQGLVVGDMDRGRGGSWILLRSKESPAVTRFFSVSIPGRRPGLRLYLLRPRTGRTHQLRVALKSISAPVLGDPLYSRFDLARQEDRTYLHAAGIRFQLNDRTETLVVYPREGEEFLSAGFREACTSLGDFFQYGQASSNSDKSSSKHESPDSGRAKQTTRTDRGTGRNPGNPSNQKRSKKKTATGRRNVKKRR